MQNLKDYFGYVHACELFRMLISTKNLFGLEKKNIRRLLKKIKHLTFYDVINAFFFFFFNLQCTFSTFLNLLYVTNICYPQSFLRLFIHTFKV